MKYLLDFDRTLFDTAAFGQQVNNDGEGSHLFDSDIWKKYQASDYLFPEVIDWLEQKNKEDLFIVTAYVSALGLSAQDYQAEKLRSSKIEGKVESVILVKEDKGKVVAKITDQFLPDEPVVFVDDKIEQCLSVRAHAPQVQCFLMVRNRSVVGEIEEVKGIKIVSSLKELDVMIKEI